MNFVICLLPRLFWKLLIYGMSALRFLILNMFSLQSSVTWINQPQVFTVSTFLLLIWSVLTAQDLDVKRGLFWIRGRKFYLFFLLAFWQSSDKSELIKKKIILQVLENKPGHFLWSKWYWSLSRLGSLNEGKGGGVYVLGINVISESIFVEEHWMKVRGGEYVLGIINVFSESIIVEHFSEFLFLCSLK